MPLPYIKRHLDAMSSSKMKNYILPGLLSSLIGKEGFGKVRMFEATRHPREVIVPHSHRFDLLCYVIAGSVVNSIWEEGETLRYPCADTFNEIRQTRNDGMGNYETIPVTTSDGSYQQRAWHREPTEYHAGQWYFMTHSQIHSIEFRKGTSVLLFEGPEVTTTSTVLVPAILDNPSVVADELLRKQAWSFIPVPEDDKTA